VALMALAASLAMAACGSSRSTGGGSPAGIPGKAVKLIDFANFSDDTALLVGLQKGLSASAQKAGINLHTYNNNGDAGTALSNARLMVLDKPDAILEFNPVSDAGQRLGQMFDTAKVPCVAITITFPGCAWFNQSDAVLAQEMAQTMAASIKAKGWTGANTEVLLLGNPQAGPSVAVWLWDVYADLSKRVPGMTPKSASSFSMQTTTIGKSGLQVDAGNNLQNAYSATRTALQTIPASKHLLVFTINDDVSLGALRAIKAAGRSDDTMMTGFGGDPQAIAQLRTNPAWVAESSTFVTLWGEYLIALGDAIGQGIKAPTLTLAPEAVLTKANVNNYYSHGSNPEPTSLPPLAPQDSFLLKTGVLQKFHNIKGLG
jgi:ribose transport system substrate-binding protein